MRTGIGHFVNEEYNNAANIPYIHDNKKRPIGHIANPRNQFKSRNTFKRISDYIYYKISTVVQEKNLKFRECISVILLLSTNMKRCGLSI